MLKSLTVTIALLLAGAWYPAHACTRDASATLASAFAVSRSVVLAEVVNATRTASSSDLDAADPVERVSFKVLVSWKGNSQPGSIVKLETAIGPGSCGMSIDSDMRYLVDAPAKQLAVGGIWILFVDGSTPFRLDEPSGRIGAGAERNLGQLYELAALRSDPSK